MRRSLATALVAALLLAAGCSGPADDPAPKASASTAPADPRDDVLAEIEDLPAVSLDDVEPPKAPDGFPQRETDLYAETLLDLMDSSVTDERWWTADPGRETIAAFTADLDPQTRESTLGDDYATGKNPVAQFMVSIFDEDAQPVRPPRIVEAAWNVSTDVPEGQSVPFQRVRLGVQVVYRVGEDERPVLLRRELSLNGANAFAPGAWPGFGYYSLVEGVESCPLYEDGVYVPLTRPDDDVSSYEAWLAEAKEKGWTPLGEVVERDNDLDEKRETSCGDRSES